MATLLLHKNRALRALALICAVAMLFVVRGTESSYATSASKVQWLFAGTCAQSFGPAATYALKANGTTIATYSPDSQCTCSQPISDITITDPGLLAAAGQGCANWQMVQTNTAYVSWSKVNITRPGGNNETACLFGNCTTEDPNVCNGLTQTSNQTFTAPVADQDHDGQTDCTDNDIDGDGVANATDNCPVNSNSNQLDSDGNGRGDTCDPPDVDGDGRLNINDNCPSVPNNNQADTNGNGTGDVCEVQGVVAVPWLGSEQLAHQVYSGGSIVLQAVATKLNTPGVAADLRSATWDAGDGSGPQSISVTNGLNLELEHVYTGSAGQPFTATITAIDGGNNVFTDTFKVVIASNSRETKVNMAIDRGLWNLHKTLVRGTVDGAPSGNWAGPYNLPATASAVQAFEINNHRESADPAHDPYVDDVARGLRNIFAAANIQKLTTFGLQNGNNPDGNGNGYGLWVNNNDHSTYIGGQVIDAIVASGTPDKVTITGINPGVKGQTYKTVVQDLLDGYSWGIADNRGGWFYGMQDTNGSNDVSASHWWAIGVLASHTWNLDAPQWVKNIQLNIGVPLTQDYNPNTACAHTANGSNGTTNNDGHFGYTDSKSWLWDNGTNTTAAGLVLLNADGVAQTNSRFTCASQFLADRYNTSMGNFYTMYQLTKAMRTAFDGAGTTAPITNLNGTIDWYAGYADYLVNNQGAKGAFTSNGQTGVNQDLASAWAIIILSPSLFELPPSAACTVNPATIGKFGGAVNFSAAASFHPDPTATITGYSWNFDDGTAAGAGVSTSHTYAVPASFPTTRNATVTVTDSNGNSSTASCPVTIVNNNVPPAVSIAGPYTVCKGSPLTLTASATDEDGTVNATAWDISEPISFSPIDGTGNTIDATAAFAAKAVGTYNVGFRATDDNGASSSAFSTVTVIAANHPSCNQPPVAVDDSASTLSGTPVSIAVLSNDTDSDNNTLTIDSTTPASNGTIAVNGDGTITYTPNTGFAGTDTFTYTIGDGHGGSDTATVTVTVTKRSATLTAGSGTKVYGTADSALTPISSGFLGDITITQTPRDSGENVGSYATHATATGATIANYNVTYSDGAFTITPATTTTVISCSNAIYNGAAQETCTASVSGANLAQSLSVSYANNVNVGTATGSASYAGDANHTGSDASATFEITPATTTTVVTCSDVVYNGAAQETCTASVSGAGGFSQSLSVTYANNVNVGTATGSASYAGDPNHSGSNASATFQITPLAATVTADSGTKVFGSADPTLGASSTGFLAADNITASFTGRDGGENVGSYATHATAAGAALGNYNVTYTDGALTITKADSTASATGGSFTYDGNSHAGSCSFAGVNGEVLNGTLSYSSGATPVAAGSYTVTCDFAGNANYNASTASATITIAKANAVCSVTGYTVTYNTAAHTATGTCTGVNGATLAGLDLAASTHTNAGTYNDAWTFTDVTGNYNNTSGSVVDVIKKAPTKTTLAISTAVAAAGAPVTLTATVVSVLPGAGTPNLTVTFTEGATVLGTSTLNASGVATLTTTTLSNGPHTITATYNESPNFLSSTSNTVSTLIFGFAAGGGTFVIGDNNATLNNQVMFWGAQWEKNNSMTGGSSNASFKGFAISPAAPTVGQTFTSAPGNSAPPPAGVPQYLGIIVTSKVTKSGSNISGTIVKLVVVKVDAGYEGNPGHAGTGKIVAFVQ